jgi:hypothetical protein
MEGFLRARELKRPVADESSLSALPGRVSLNRYLRNIGNIDHIHTVQKPNIIA